MCKYPFDDVFKAVLLVYSCTKYYIVAAWVACNYVGEGDMVCHSAGTYQYLDDLVALQRCKPTSPWRTVPSEFLPMSPSLPWQAWDRRLASHPDQQFRKLIVEGLRDGFRVGFDYPHHCRSSKRNLLSSLQQPQVIRDYLAEECAAGRVIGPLQPDDFPLVQVSPFGVIPKKTPGKWRLIVDLSAPDGHSVNDGVSSGLCSLDYVTIDDAAKMITQEGNGALLAKVDIRHAYRNIPVHPDDRWLFGMLWEGALFVDTALPFGLRSAPKLFNAVADAVEWILRQAGVVNVIHYLDDFLLVGAPGSPECAESLAKLLEIFAELGLPVALDKLEGPVCQLPFLGFELDSILMEVRLPVEKLAALNTVVSSWLDRRSCTRKELESLVGSLGHAARVVQPGRTFLRRMFELLSVPRKPFHFVRLNASFRSDLLWWHVFLEPLNGVSLTRRLAPVRCQIQFATDASGSVGCGAVCLPWWLQLKWSEYPCSVAAQRNEDSITLRELLPIILACAVWGPYWLGHSVVVHCDNTGAVAVVNSGYSRVPAIMHLLRCLFFIRARFNICLRAVHIPGVCNALADAVSRDNLAFLFSQIPEAVSCRTLIPPALCALLLDQPDWTSPRWTQLFGSCFPPV